MTSTSEMTRRADIAPRSRARTSGRMMAIASGCVLAGALLAAGPASAASRGFVVHNHSTHVLHLEAVEPIDATACRFEPCDGPKFPMEFEGRPAVGSALNPGRAERFELKWRFSILLYDTQYAADIRYRIGNTDNSVEYKIYTSTVSNDSRCAVHPSTAGRCTAAGTALTFHNQ